MMSTDRVQVQRLGHKVPSSIKIVTFDITLKSENNK